MAGSKRKVHLPDGSTVSGEPIQVVQSQELFCTYSLEDGTLLRLKPVLTEVFKVDDRWDANGEPVYLIRSQNVMVVSAPESLRKKD